MARPKGMLIQIATGDSRPISRQIVDGVRLRIATGELRVGDALPSVRGLAQQLTINPNTVAKAYAELTAEGWLESRQGLGLFVATPRQRLSEAERARRFDEAVQRFVGEVIALGMTAREVKERLAEELAGARTEAERVIDHVIETRGLRKRFGKKLVLDGLDLRIAAGGIHALVGANGAGKSTLFRILLGFLPASAGEARILGCDSRHLGPADRGRIGFVTEEHTLPGWLRVDELVAMQRGHYSRWDEPVFRAVMSNFSVEPRQRVGHLSRGERAGLSLALALGQAPELLVLDEPTLGLDIVARRAVLEAVLDASTAQRCTVVYCSHLTEEIERLADHMVMLDAGRLVCTATPDEFRARVRLWVADIPFRGPDPAEVPGLLDVRQLDGLVHYLVLDQGDAFAEYLRDAGARSVNSAPVSLDRAIDGVLARRRASLYRLPSGPPLPLLRTRGASHA